MIETNVVLPLYADNMEINSCVLFVAHSKKTLERCFCMRLDNEIVFMRALKNNDVSYGTLTYFHNYFTFENYLGKADYIKLYGRSE